MSRYHSYLNSAVHILEQYSGSEPFASFLKKFFSIHKKYGSSDRKQISHLCYSTFRLGKAVQDRPVKDRIQAALFLCSAEPNVLLAGLHPDWNTIAYLPPEEKAAIVGIADVLTGIFPWRDELSPEIDSRAFNRSLLVQPNLFLRLRPGKEESVMQKLHHAGISFERIGNDCVVLPNSSKAAEVIMLNKEAVIQDYSSQRTGNFLTLLDRRPGMHVWDCCAASGGKSIMAIDQLGRIDLAVSDIRHSILINLKKRFSEAGIGPYRSFCADLSSPVSLPVPDKFDLIICDVPCTGSGTWGRTPEQLFYFDESRIGEYAQRQRQIVSNVLPHLRPGGYLLYCTCSVFKKENEDIAAFLHQSGLTVIRQQVLKGYDKKADTLFAALLGKPL